MLSMLCSFNWPIICLVEGIQGRLEMRQHITQEMPAARWKDQTVELDVGGGREVFNLNMPACHLGSSVHFSFQELLGPYGKV